MYIAKKLKLTLNAIKMEHCTKTGQVYISPKDILKICTRYLLRYISCQCREIQEPIK